MIPKVIHYCWFGGKPLPRLAKKCIASWQKYLPDYEIKRWDEFTFNVFATQFSTDAYDAHNWAFVSDYARLWIIYNYGGIYFDTDVEVIKPMDDIISRGAFVGCENAVRSDIPAEGQSLDVALGLGFAACKHNELIGKILNIYEHMEFDRSGKTWGSNNIVRNTATVFSRHGLKPTNDIQSIEDFTVYPKEYFCPMDYGSGKITMTDRTRTIHHYTASWLGFREKMYGRLCRYFGQQNIDAVYSKIKPIIGN